MRRWRRWRRCSESHRLGNGRRNGPRREIIRASQLDDLSARALDLNGGHPVPVALDIDARFVGRIVHGLRRAVADYYAYLLAVYARIEQVRKRLDDARLAELAQLWGQRSTSAPNPLFVDLLPLPQEEPWAAVVADIRAAIDAEARGEPAPGQSVAPRPQVAACA